ncbi:hypothetical protein C8R44DRAFT_783802 [Mycena epipterygia]|nr:hypothetical protein C8R44DRAFT_783802 [Mycena epipterygia]
MGDSANHTPRPDDPNPAFDVALNAFLLARDSAAQSFAQSFAKLSATSGALRAEYDSLRGECVLLKSLLQNERAAREFELGVMCADRAAFEEALQRLHAEQVVILRDREVLSEKLEDTHRTIQHTVERAERDSKAISGFEEAERRLRAEKVAIVRERDALAIKLKDIQKTAERTQLDSIKSEDLSMSHFGPGGVIVVKHEPQVTRVKSEFSRPDPTLRKRDRPEGDVKFKAEEPRNKMLKLTPSKTDAVGFRPGARKVEVVIERPTRPHSRVSVTSNSLGPSAARLITPLPNEGSTSSLPHSLDPSASKTAVPLPDFNPSRLNPILKDHHQHLFDLANLPTRAAAALVTRHIHLFDLATLVPRGAQELKLVGEYRHIFDFATLPPRTKSRIPWMPSRNGSGPLLDAPVFKQCAWSTEFFQKAFPLHSLFADPSLAEYFPFIKRLLILNEAGVQPSRRSIGRPAVSWDSLLDTNNTNTTYSWGCVLRFLVLDMLLLCKGYKAAPQLVPDGNMIPKAAQPFTKKLYKWQNHIADAIDLKDEGREGSGVPDPTAELGGAQAHRNLLLTALGIMSFLEESSLPSPDDPPDSLVLSSLSNFHKLPARTRDKLPAELRATTIYHHLAVYLFISPLGILVNQDLVAPIIATQHLFHTTRALGTMRPPRIEIAEKYVRNVVCKLINDPALDVRGAFAHTEGAPGYMPPPYTETFFNAGVPAKVRYD